MRKTKSPKRSSRKKAVCQTIEIRGKRYKVDRETLKQLKIGRAFLAEYRETLEMLAKT